MNVAEYSQAAGASSVSAAIVTYNSAEEIIELLHSMQIQLDLTRMEVFVIDNASTDDTVVRVEKGFPWVHLLRNEHNDGFGAAHNRLLGRLCSTYHAVINPDVVFLEDSLKILTAYLDEHPEVVMATPRVYNRDGTPQHLPKVLPTPRYLLARRLAPHSRRSQQLNRAYTREGEDLLAPTAIEHATGAFFVIRSEAFVRLGGFDERFFMYFEDNDLSCRAAALGQIVFYPDTAIAHGYARTSARSPRAFYHLLSSALRYFRKHGWR
jgi:GT2 family glycosyltransferase